MTINKYLMGIDAGTSSIKVVIFENGGEEKYVSSIKNEYINKYKTWAEQDMKVLWETLSKTIREVMIKNKINPEDIKAIGVTGQGEGCWLIDHKGNPVRNAILWCDSRASKIVDEIKSDNKRLEEIKKITGSYVFTGATSIILKWLKENELYNLEKASYCLFCKDWLSFKLTGKINSDITDASTSLLDLSSKKISDELLEILDIAEYRRLFPSIIKSCDLSGNVSKEAAEHTGLKEGTPVVAGMMDVVAASVGMGAVKEGDCCTIIGTTCSNEVVRASHKSDIDNLSGFECHAVDNMYLNVIAAMAGTPNLDWVIANLFMDEKNLCDKENKNLYEFLEEKIKDIPPGADGVIYHPYISNAGERAPFFNPNARAQFFGISSSTNKYHLLKSVYEGVAFSIRDCIDGIQNLQRIYLGGGGAKSFYWAKIISDCTGKEVVIPDGCEFAAKGAALAAGVQIGIYDNISNATLKTLKIKKKFIPNESKHKKYTDIYRLYRVLREKENDIWNIRNQIFIS